MELLQLRLHAPEQLRWAAHSRTMARALMLTHTVSHCQAMQSLEAPRTARATLSLGGTGKHTVARENGRIIIALTLQPRGGRLGSRAPSRLRVSPLPTFNASSNNVLSRLVSQGRFFRTACVLSGLPVGHKCICYTSRRHVSGCTTKPVSHLDTQSGQPEGFNDCECSTCTSAAAPLA